MPIFALRTVSLLMLAVGTLWLGGPAHAQGKPGMWAFTVETHTPETRRAEADFKKRLQAMSPEHRKRLLGNMEKAGVRAGAPHTQTFPVCRTADDARRLALYLPPEFEGRCTPQSITRSGERSVKALLNCTGTPKTSGEGEYRFPSDTAMDGRTTLRVTPQGKGKKPETVSVHFKGEWKAAECPSNLPPSPQ